MPRSLRAGMIADFFFFFIWSEVEVEEGFGVSSTFEEAEDEWLEAVEEVLWRVRVGCVAWAAAEALEAAFLGSTYLTLIRILLRRVAGEGRAVKEFVGVLTR